MSDETVNPTGQEPERVGFCQDCGRPLTAETAKTVGSRMFCEPCLTTRVAAGTAYGVGAVPPPPASGAGPAAGPGAVPPGYTEPFPPMGGSNPSPALAAVLGFIPGVGAMYNGQFAKGIAHIVIFAVLQSMANYNGFFGVLVAGFVFYQVFEAYHTAKARRDGMPLPDPFGLNHIGEHVGVHFNQRGPGAPNPGQPTSYPGWTGYVPPQGVVTPPPPPAGEWQGVATPPPVAPYTQAAPVWDTPAWTPPPSGTVPPAEVFAPAAPPVSMASRVPCAAFWLIGFGVLFTILNFVPDWRFSLVRIFPFVLMALGVGLFVRRMWSTGGLTPAETEGLGYGPRVACSLRGPVILITLGVLTMLQSFDVVRFGRTWPILVIVIGVMLLLERSLGARAVPVVPIVIDDSGVASGNGKGL